MDGLDGAWDCDGGGPQFEPWQVFQKNGWFTDFKRKGSELDPRVDLSWQMGRKGRKQEQESICKFLDHLAHADVA